MRLLVKAVLLVGLFLWVSGQDARIARAEVTTEQISLAVLGEALHDSESMRYMAHAVVNRTNRIGSFKGIYGYEVARTRSYPQKALEMAKKAVSEVATTPDPTHGATHWLSDYDLKHCKPERMAWRFKMMETAYQGSTHFYKEV